MGNRADRINGLNAGLGSLVGYDQGTLASRLLRLVFAVAVGIAVCWHCGALAQEPCTPIRFQSGQNSTEITGVAQAGGYFEAIPTLCYSLTVGDAHQAKVTLLSGQNVAVTIPTMGDARDAFEFVTDRGTYELHVFQPLPAAEDEFFRIRVEVLDTVRDLPSTLPPPSSRSTYTSMPVTIGNSTTATPPTEAEQLTTDETYKMVKAQIPDAAMPNFPNCAHCRDAKVYNLIKSQTVVIKRLQKNLTELEARIVELEDLAAD